MSEATQLLERMGDGDPQAAARLLPLVYDELQRIARSQMAHERVGHTLQATVLVHDAYLRLMTGAPGRWDSRRHFVAVAAEAMRRILVEHARRKKSFKRGGRHEHVGLDDDHLPEICSPCVSVDDLLSLDEALDRLTKEDAVLRRAHLDQAAALGISRTSAYRQWVFTRAWLCDAMTPPKS